MAQAPILFQQAPKNEIIRQQTAALMAPQRISNVGEGISSAARNIMAAFLQKKELAKKKKKQSAYNETLSSALGAMQGGVKEWRDPDTGALAIKGQKPGLDALAQVLSGNPDTAPMAGNLLLARALKKEELANKPKTYGAPVVAVGPDGKRMFVRPDSAGGMTPVENITPPKKRTPIKTISTAEGVYVLNPDGTKGERLGSTPTRVQTNVTLPKGYRPTDDGGMEPIPGSPAAIKEKETEEKAKGRKKTRARAGTTVLQDIGRAINLVEKNWTASGVPALVMSKVPGTDAYVVSAHIQSALSNVGLDTLQNMRENNKTGGGLGQVPIQQQKRLEQVLGSLEVSQPKDVLMDNLKRVHNIYMDIVYGTPEEIAAFVKDGTITAKEAAPISNRFALSFDDFGNPIKPGEAKQAEGKISIEKPANIEQDLWDYMTDDERALFAQ